MWPHVNLGAALLEDIFHFLVREAHYLCRLAQADLTGGVRNGGRWYIMKLCQIFAYNFSELGAVG